MSGCFAYGVLNVEKYHVFAESLVQVVFCDAFGQEQRNEETSGSAHIVDSFVSNVTRTKGVDLSIKLCDLD